MTALPTIYSVGRAPEWLEVAARMRNELGWEPAYWVTVSGNGNSVAAAFPNAILHDFIDLNRCLPAPVDDLRQGGHLDNAVLEEFSAYEHVVMEMMDRMDLHGSFTYLERQRSYLWLLSYWLRTFDRLRWRVAVFNVPPHSPGEYVLYAVCRERGVETRLFLPTPVVNLHLVSERYDRLPVELTCAYERRLSQEGGDRVSDRVLDQINAVRAQDHRPWYVSEGQQRDERRSLFKKKVRAGLDAGELHGTPLRLDPDQPGLFGGTRRTADDAKPIRRVYKRPGEPLAAEPLCKAEYKTYLRWAQVKKLELEDAYNARVQETDLGKPYVYLALHYQPERTTCPDGGRFNNQFLVAAMIAHQLPEGWSLYVKEHPGQFYYHNNGDQSRIQELYEDLSALPSTRLISLKTPSTTLIESARAVATVTGVVGWEALVREVPALVFGAAWYCGCRGAYPVATREELSRALEHIRAGDRPTFRDVVAYGGALEDVGAVCYTNTSLAVAVDTDYESQIKALSEALLRFERTTP